MEQNYEEQYTNSLIRLLEKGIKQTNRTGIDTYVVQHQYFYLKDICNNFPAIRGKKIFPKLALKELIWFLCGRVDKEFLHENNVHYWDEWFINNPESNWNNTIGPSYGWQFRNFNGVDQVEQTLRLLLKDPLSRRNIINLWNVSELKEMSLTPCVYDYHFECTPDDKNFFVDLHVRSRSEDSFLGCPYDFCNVAWLLNIICDILNCYQNEVKYLPRDIHFTCDNYHLYENHIEQVKKYLENYEIGLKQNLFNKPIIFKSTLIDNWDYPKYVDSIWIINKFLENFFNSEKKFDIFKLDKYETSFDKIQADVAV